MDAESFDAFHQYCLSKAALCFFTQGLNDRLDAAGIGSIIALQSDPGTSATGMGGQANPGFSILGLEDGLLTANTFRECSYGLRH